MGKLPKHPLVVCGTFWKKLTIKASNEGLKEDGATTYWWAISTRSGCVAGSKSWGLSYNPLGAVFLSSGSWSHLSMSKIN